MDTNKKQHDPGHYISLGIAVGLSLGLVIGLAIGNIGIGPAIGVALGAGIGTAWEAWAQSQGKIRELTPEEKKRMRIKRWVVFAIGLIFAVMLGFYFTR